MAVSDIEILSSTFLQGQSPLHRIAGLIVASRDDEDGIVRQLYALEQVHPDARRIAESAARGCSRYPDLFNSYKDRPSRPDFEDWDLQQIGANILAALGHNLNPDDVAHLLEYLVKNDQEVRDKVVDALRQEVIDKTDTHKRIVEALAANTLLFVPEESVTVSMLLKPTKVKSRVGWKTSAQNDSDRDAYGVLRPVSVSILIERRGLFGIPANITFEPTEAMLVLRDELPEHLRSKFDRIVADWDTRHKEERKRLEAWDRKAAREKIARFIQAKTRDPELHDTKHAPDSSIDVDLESRGTDSVTPSSPLMINPEVPTLRVNILLFIAATILKDPLAATQKLELAMRNAGRACEIARSYGMETLGARSEFYIGLATFRQGSIRQAVEHFEGALAHNNAFIESMWAREWLDKCEELVAATGDWSAKTSANISPTSDASAESCGKRLPPQYSRPRRNKAADKLRNGSPESAASSQVHKADSLMASPVPRQGDFS